MQGTLSASPPPVFAFSAFSVLVRFPVEASALCSSFRVPDVFEQVLVLELVALLVSAGEPFDFEQSRSGANRTMREVLPAGRPRFRLESAVCHNMIYGFG